MVVCLESCVGENGGVWKVVFVRMVVCLRSCVGEDGGMLGM